MKKFLLGSILLLSTCPLFGQATTGFHRNAVALARAFQGVTAQVVPNAKVTVTATGTGLAATIYSDPGLSSQITPAVVTADNSGNYGYYIPLNYCVTETISAPGQGQPQVITNICINGSGGSSISLTTTGTTGASTLVGTVLNIPVYQGQLSLTTTGSSGAATLVGNVLNIPQYSGGGSTAFSALTGSTNTTAAMLVGTGASLGVTGTGTINATAIDGVTVTGTPTSGQVPVASGSSAAAWGPVPTSGVQYQPATTQYVVYSASVPIVDTTDNCVTSGNFGLAIASYSISGNTLSGVYSSLGTLVAGNHITLSGFGTSTFLNGQQIIISGTGLSSTTFQAPFTHANTSATENGIGNCSGVFPSVMQTLNFFNGHGTVVNEGIGGGATAATMVSDFASLVAPHLTATTGNPSWFMLMPSSNDFGAATCPLATIEPEYQAQLAWAHLAGATNVGLMPLQVTTGGLGACTNATYNYGQLGKWLRGQSAGPVNSTQVTTTATASSSSATITVASATGLHSGMAVVCTTGTDLHTFITGAYTSGTTVNISPNTTGSLSSTSCTFTPGTWDYLIDTDGVATNGGDSEYYDQGGLKPHPTETTHRLVANRINNFLSAYGSDSAIDNQGPRISNGPTSYNTPTSGGSTGATVFSALDVNSPTAGSGSLFLNNWDDPINSIDRWWFSLGGSGASNIAMQLVALNGSIQLDFWNTNGICWNGTSGAGSAPIIGAITMCIGNGDGSKTLYVGNGGTMPNSGGNVDAAGYISGGTKFTTSGCSISSTTGGATAGVFTLGANTCTAIITMNGATGLASPHGWSCQAHDQTAPTVLIGGESSSNTTTASITIPAGAGATDVISFSCVGY